MYQQGKAHKKYEYGCKASVVLTQKTGIIVGAMTFKTNVYDGHTLEEVLEQTTELTGKIPKTATVDRGYQGKQQIGRPKFTFQSHHSRETVRTKKEKNANTIAEEQL